MKQDIHPKYYDTKFSCACGNTWVGGGTVAEFSLDICSNCHPFYTGKQKTLDTRGRIDRFMKRAAAGVNAKKAAKAESSTEEPKA